MIDNVYSNVLEANIRKYVHKRSLCALTPFTILVL